MKIRPASTPGSVTVEISRKDEDLLTRTTRAPLPINLILVPVDFSDFSYKSVDYASAFALQSRAKIILLHVIPLNYIETEIIAFDYSQLEKQTTASCEARLADLKRSRIDPSIETSIRVKIGRPVDEIVSAASELKADLIIMSTHGYTGLKHAFLGSTTENVVRYAPCPVLTVRQHEHDFVQSRSVKEST